MFSKIVVAYDGTESAHDILDEAVELAAKFRAKVHLLAVAYRTPGEIVADSVYATGEPPADEAAMRRAVKEAEALFVARGCTVETHVAIDDRPEAAIHELAAELHAELIILGHRRQGPLGRLWNGSTGISLLANAPCSVFVAMRAPR
jgi:nucleotide-binding universal stress UspA family protein